MWTELEIIDDEISTYFFMCNLVSNETEVRYFLCDLNVIWSEKISLDLFSERLKDLNKRIEYDYKTALETINNQKPTNASCEMKNSLKILNLKFYVSDRPLIFSWNLKLCEQNEFKKFITNPLLIALNILSKQTEILLEIIKKKDIEIEQYKIEGAELKRTKVSTEPFNVQTFQGNFPKILTFDNILSFTNEHINSLKSSCEDSIEETNISKPSLRVSTEETKSLKKRSPIKSKKKKFLHNQEIALEKRLKARELKINYDDSDSPCTPPFIIHENPDEHFQIKKRKLNELKV